MFPLAEGRVWKYHTTISYTKDSELVHEDMALRSLGVETYGDSTVWRRRSDLGVDYWLKADDSGVYRVASKTDASREPMADSQPRYVLRKPYVVGTEWMNTTALYVLDRPTEYRREFRKSHSSMPMTYKITALDEKVKTPAGNFESCIKVQGSASIKLYIDATGIWDNAPIKTTEWYCPNVGLTKLVREEISPTKMLRGGGLVMELTSFK